MTDKTTDQPMTEEQIRADLGEILDQLNSLPSDAFAEKSKLQKRKTELTRLLREIEIPGAEDMKKDWAEAAAAKRFAEEPTEMIVSPMESGSGGGG
jgi:hypothetical protein